MDDSILKSPLVKRLISLAVEEDFSGGDITSGLTINQKTEAVAQIVARQKLVACGLPLIPRIVASFGFSLKVKNYVTDGATVKSGTVLCELRGRAQEILSVERTILNFLQHLSGVATYTSAIVAQAKKLTILDTRKTRPGLRILEKYAVSVGGARNHRFGLGDMILVKNNHIDINKTRQRGLGLILAEINRKKPKYMPVEVEVRDLAELSQALVGRPDIIMLDNMSDAQVKRAVTAIKASGQHCQVEVSGGISPKRFKTLANLGVSVSMGALTRLATMVDISLRIKS